MQIRDLSTIIFHIRTPSLFMLMTNPLKSNHKPFSRYQGWWIQEFAFFFRDIRFNFKLSLSKPASMSNSSILHVLVNQISFDIDWLLPPASFYTDLRFDNKKWALFFFYTRTLIGNWYLHLGKLDGIVQKGEFNMFWIPKSEPESSWKKKLYERITGWFHSKFL